MFLVQDWKHSDQKYNDQRVDEYLIQQKTRLADKQMLSNQKNL